MKFKILIGLIVLFLITAAFVFRPVPIVTEDKALIDKGIVVAIYEGGVKDIAFRLEHNDRVYYINRGLEQGLEIEDLKTRLMGNEVVFKYPKYWTPLDWNDKIKHVSKLEIKGQVLFNELKN